MKCFWTLSISILLTIAAATANAATINVDFNSTASNGTPNTNVAGTYSGTAVASDTGTFWNAITNNLGGGTSTPFTALKDSQGTTTSVSFTANSYATTDVTTDPGSNRVATFKPSLFDDYLYDNSYGNTNRVYPATGGVNATFSIGGLAVGGTYDLILYSQNGGYNNATTKFNIGGTIKTVTNTGVAGGSASFIAGTNYVVYSGLVADGTGKISGVFATGNGTNFATFNGFQLTAISIVPEPATAGLLLGTLPLASLRRRAR